MLRQCVRRTVFYRYVFYSTTQQKSINTTFMKLALRHAQAGFRSKEMPVGAVIADDAGEVISTGHNKCWKLKDKKQHAELIAMRNAVKHFGRDRLVGTTLYTTLEPNDEICEQVMEYRIRHVVFGVQDRRFGAVEGNEKINFTARVLERECEELFKNYYSTVDISIIDSNGRGFFSS